MARMILISSQSSSMAGWELSGTIEAYLCKKTRKMFHFPPHELLTR